MQVIFAVTENNLIIVQLDAFIRKYYKNKLIRGCIYTAAVLLSLFLLLVLLEYFGYFPSLVRGILFWCYISMTAILVCYWVLLPLSKMRRLGKCISYEQAAIIIGDYFPEVKDKLLNLLQLQGMSSVADSDLLSASIKQKTDSLSPIPFKNAIKLNANKKYLKYVVAPLVLIVLLLIFVPSSITGPSKRIVNYDVNYDRPAPFEFVVENDVLEAIQQDDYLLRVAIDGDVLPAEVYIEADGLQYKMQPVDKSHFTYLFKQIHATVHFKLRAAGVVSNEYILLVHPKPSVIDFQVSLTFPSYTHQQDLTLSNQGDITVSQGTLVRWLFLTRDVDVFHFISNGTVQDIVPDANGRVVIQCKAMSSFEYEFVSSNKNVVTTDTLAYAITVVPDASPMIVVAQSDDSTLPDRKFFQGYIKDDYGFSKLLFRAIVNNESDSAVVVRHDYNVAISSEVSQEFLFSFDMGNLNLNPGDRVQYYFEIWDNDAIHGPKSATSQQYLLEIPSEHKLKQILDDNTSDAIVHAEQSMSDLKKLQSEINELMRKLVDKNELSWQDKKQLQELANKQKQVKEELSKMQQQLRQNNMLEQKYRDQSQQIMQKQQELDKLLNEVLNDEMKDMMREIDKLMEEIDKNKVQEHLENLKLDNEQLEKQIDQDIDLLKRLELEKKVEDAIQKASELSDKQRELAKETENASSKDLEQLKSKQQQLSEQFKELKSDIKEIQQEYKEINEDYNFNVDKQLENKIDQLQQEAQQKSANGKRKEASKAQQEAADALQQLSDQ
ncbi:MAG: hypothetical protein KBT04_03745, partial [Bacteroidales bacterium]|nr:hypothetical protein [Candidatus Colimorpha onthohippi]